MTILNDVKKGLGVNEQNLGFDHELLMTIDAVKSNLVQLGIADFDDITINQQTEWPDLTNGTLESLVKQYFLIRTKQYFDPIPSESIAKVFENRAIELEGRIQTAIDELNLGTGDGGLFHTHPATDVTGMTEFVQLLVDEMAVDLSLHTLNELGNVTITGLPDVDDILVATGAGGWANAALSAAGISEVGHEHTESDITDLDRYTQTEVNSLLSGKSDTTHTHTEVDVTDLDKYTQTEVNSLLSGKSDTTHTHTESDVTDLDKYTQTEVNSLLSGKSDTTHTHTEADITDLDKYTQTEVNSLLSGKSDTTHTHTEADITDLGSYLQDITGESLDDLSNVTVAGTPAAGELLVADGADGWGNATPAEANLSEVGHIHLPESMTTAERNALVDPATGYIIYNTDVAALQVFEGEGWASVSEVGHAAQHTDGTDDIQNATAAQKGLATATQITKLDGIEAGADVTDATNVAAAGALMATGGTMSGDIAMADNEIQRAVLKDTGEAGEIDASSTATKTLDIAAQGNNFDITLDSNCTLTFSNPSSSGTWCWISIILRQDGDGNRTVTWPGSVDWGDAGAPTLKTGGSEYDIFSFLTIDGGTTWLGTSLYAAELETHMNSTAEHGATGAVVGTTNTQTLTNKTLEGVTLSGAVIGGGQTVNDVVLKDYGEAASIVASSGTTQTIDLSIANYWKVTLSDNCTFTFSNPPASGTVGSFTLKLMQDGTGSRTVTWPASVDWAGGTPPTLTTTATTGKDVFTFFTDDGGTTWLGMVAGLAFA